METKLNVKFKNCSLEVEGEESFVKQIYNDFMELVFKDKDLELEEPDFEDNENKGKSPKHKKSPPKISIEEFDVEGDEQKSIISLNDFLSNMDKSKLSTIEFILCIAYYINKILDVEDFSDGNIEFAYKYLEQKGRPAHLRQVITNNKNTDRWFEPSEINKKKWVIGRLGETYFEKNILKK